ITRRPDGFVVGTVVICSTFPPPPTLAPEVVLKPIFSLVLISIRDAYAVRSMISHIPCSMFSSRTVLPIRRYFAYRALCECERQAHECRSPHWLRFVLHLLQLDGLMRWSARCRQGQ